MDTPNSAAERMRPILQAMERSIDDARRRRSNAHPTANETGAPDKATVAGGPPAMAHSATTIVPAARLNGVHGPAVSPTVSQPAFPHAPARSPGATRPTAAANPAISPRPQTPTQPLPHLNTHNDQQPQQPARLKARPKRLDSPFLTQPNYRAQAG